MGEKNMTGLPKSKPCSECVKSNRSGRLELLRSFDLERGKEIFFALCTQKGCLYHTEKMPLFMYERESGGSRKK